MYKSKHVLETEIEEKLRKGVKKLGGMALKWVSPGNGGVPDRLVFLPGGMVIFVELKADDGYLSEKQKKMHKKLKRCGIPVHVVKGEDAAKRFLGECKRWCEIQEDTTDEG